MNTNTSWGALGFLTSPKKEASTKSEPARGLSLQDRLSKAKELPKTSEGYRKAADLRVWLSSSKKSGVMPLEKMDVAYMVNTLKMLSENRHSVIKKNDDAALHWMLLLEKEIEKASKERGESK
ncbi:hypothetical protein [Halomonas sp. BMC6]|uniref:hypothetical protein n=1 Tax=Halomonas sp. BMC6 TaxID=3073244 RepID=UPI0030D209AA